MTDLLLRDDEGEHDRGGEHVPTTRTLVFDLEAPWLLHALFRSEAYANHLALGVDTDVTLVTEGGYAVGKVYSTDGKPPGEYDLEDFVDTGDQRPHDKAAMTFRSDLHDVDAVRPAILKAVDAVRPIKRETEERAST